MNNITKIIIFIIIVLGGIFLLGYYDIAFTNVITREKRKIEQDIEYDTYKHSQSYVDGKKTEALKYYNEYNQLDEPEDKIVMKNIVRLAFADFNEQIYLDEPLRSFVYDCKYKYE